MNTLQAAIAAAAMTMASATAADAQKYTATAPQLGSKGGVVAFDSVPDGNYRVRVVLGGSEASSTVVRAESRRLLADSHDLEAGRTQALTFMVNKRDTLIAPGRCVRIKPRERSKLNWDSRLTIEFAGKAPAVVSVEAERVEGVPTVFLCGNSTVVDQDNEPWASWGQMLPRLLDSTVCVANYGESGESSNTFIAARRLEKISTQIKAGDYLFVEFGHNDEKQRGDDKGPYKHFTQSLRKYIELARSVGATPVLVTPTQRRKFAADGRLADTHGEFPEAVRALARAEGVALIDLTEMTTRLYEALGDEGSKRAFVHYPAGTYPGQRAPLADNTHFNPYGAMQIAKCIVEGIRAAGLPLAQHLAPDYRPYDPAHPDPADAFEWFDAPNVEMEKPDGN